MTTLIKLRFNTNMSFEFYYEMCCWFDSGKRILDEYMDYLAIEHHGEFRILQIA